MHSFIHGFMLLDGLAALKPLGLLQGRLGNQCSTLPECRLAFKSLSARRNGEFKRFVGKNDRNVHMIQVYSGNSLQTSMLTKGKRKPKHYRYCR